MLTGLLNGRNRRLFCLCHSIAHSAIGLGYSGEHSICACAGLSLRI